MCAGGPPDVSFMVLLVQKSDGWVDKLDCALQELGEVPEWFAAMAAEGPPWKELFRHLNSSLLSCQVDLMRPMEPRSLAHHLR